MICLNQKCGRELVMSERLRIVPSGSSDLATLVVVCPACNKMAGATFNASALTAAYKPEATDTEPASPLDGFETLVGKTERIERKQRWNWDIIEKRFSCPACGYWMKEGALQKRGVFTCDCGFSGPVHPLVYIERGSTAARDHAKPAKAAKPTKRKTITYAHSALHREFQRAYAGQVRIETVAKASALDSKTVLALYAAWMKAGRDIASLLWVKFPKGGSK